MSRTAFLSSPIRPSNICESNPNPFYTPQAKPWGSYAPPASSPLRTSKNANLMPQEFQFKNGSEDERPEPDQAFAFPTTTFFLNPTPPISSSNTQSSRVAQFQFQARAREDSPSIQLQTHTASKRDTRKRLFLDRLRTKRDDERCERGGDQVLRMDYMKERKEWEKDMQKRQLNEIEEMEENSEMYDMEEEPSPTEDKEIEELVSYLETRDQSEDDFSDEDYDALFMEVVSQETQTQPKLLNSLSQPNPSGDPDVDMS